MSKRKRIQKTINVQRKPVVDQCLAATIEIAGKKHDRIQCDKVNNGCCIAYQDPSVWKFGCPLASNKIIKDEKGKAINPLKASKRAKKGK
jgi:hypothetical protein